MPGPTNRRVPQGWLIAVVAAALPGGATQAQTHTWKAPVSGDWAVPANWTAATGDVPDSPGESALFSPPTSGTPYYAVTISANDVIAIDALSLYDSNANLVVEGSLTVASPAPGGSPTAALALGGNLSVAVGGSVRVSSAQFDHAGNVSGTVHLSGTNPSLNLNGGRGGTFVFEDNGWLYNSYVGVLPPSGVAPVVRVQGGAAADTTLTVESTTPIVSTEIILESAGGSGASNLTGVGVDTTELRNQGVITVNRGDGGTRTITAPSFRNEGTLNVNADTTVVTTAPNGKFVLGSSGTVNIAAGQMLKTGSFTLSSSLHSTLNIGPGGSLLIDSGTFSAGGGLLGGGDGGVIRLDGVSPAVDAASYRNAAYVFESSGTLKHVDPSASVRVQGGPKDAVLNLTPDTTDLVTGITLESAGGAGASRLSSTSGLSLPTGLTLTSNAGSGGARSITAPSFQQSGTFNVNTDTTVVTGAVAGGASTDGFDVYGSLNVAAGKTLTVNNLRHMTGAITMGVGGAIRVVAGSYSGAGAGTNPIHGTVILSGTNPFLTPDQDAFNSVGSVDYVFEDSGTLSGWGLSLGATLHVVGDASGDTTITSQLFGLNRGTTVLDSVGAPAAAVLNSRFSIHTGDGTIGRFEVRAGAGGARTITTPSFDNDGQFDVRADTTVVSSVSSFWNDIGGRLSVSQGKTLSVSGAFLAVEKSSFAPDVGRDGVGKLAVSSSASLGGTLSLTRAPDFDATPRQTFTLMTTSARTGTFAHVTGLDAGNGFSFAVTYTPTSVLATATLPGDADVDGIVGPADFNLLASSFSQSGKTWSSGDFDGDGTVGPGDFNLLASHFGEIAGGGAEDLSAADWAALKSFGATSVPEPAGLGLLAAAVGILARRRRRR